MILTGQGLCLPSQATVQELFSAARDASVIPDVSLDPVLTTFLSLDSPAALRHQYVFLRRGMNQEQQAAFKLNVTAELGGGSVTHGGVGVVALALSVLFDHISQQVRGLSTQGGLLPQRSQAKRIFGISGSSRIGWIIQNYLHLIPGVANDQEKMAETTELYDRWLKLELLDHYERMTTKKRMSSVSMQQWLTGVAVHLHMRIHQARLHSVPSGSAESLRLSYKTGWRHLVETYTNYLRRNIKETGAQRPSKPKSGPDGGPRQTAVNISSVTNVTCSSERLFNMSQAGPSVLTDRFNETTSPDLMAEISSGCKTNAPSEANGSTRGLLVIEPGRNVSHDVRHPACQSPAIQQALVSRIINAQDLDRNRNFFLYPQKVFQRLLKQNDDFVTDGN